jgi:hypothetical protein
MPNVRIQVEEVVRGVIIPIFDIERDAVLENW